MSKTIKQLADELGVSKTAVRNYMDEEFRCKHTATNRNGSITIDPDGCKFIAESMGKQWDKSQQTAKNFPETPESSANQNQDHLYSILEKELAAKDKQIERLQGLLEEQLEINKELAQSINADRKNELAGTLKELLPEGGEPESQDEVVVDADVEDPVLDPALCVPPTKKPMRRFKRAIDAAMAAWKGKI